MISTEKTVTVTCPKCGRFAFKVHMNANTVGTSWCTCDYCHYQATVHYHNDSFGTSIDDIG